jgi:2-oxoisovalerate dehydrogenase E2 component (dihydrolipoyl transacylase)
MTSVADFLLPDLGEGLSEAEVISWRVSPGDRVTVDQVIAEVETAKAVVEVPVPYAGVVAALHAKPGSVVSVGQPLITVTEDATAGFGEPGFGEPGVREPGVREPGFREPGVVVPEQVPAADDGGGVDGDGGEEASGSVLIGYGTTVAQARTRRGRRRGAVGARSSASAPVPAASAGAESAAVPIASAAPDSSAVPTAPAPQASVGVAAPERPGRVAVISPLVRKEARDAGLDLTALTATGPDGVLSRRDVRAAIAELARRQQPDVVDASAAADASYAGAGVNGTGGTVTGGAGFASAGVNGTGGAGAADASYAGAGVNGTGGAGAGATGTGERRIPLRGARRAVAEKLSRSRREIPEATVWVDVDATDLVETRRALNAADSSRPVSLLALLARFTILGLRHYPELNARIEDDEIVVPEAVNLGFAAQTDHGLVVPVVHDAHRLTTRDLSARLAERTTAARDRRLSPADLAGGTFTVNNYGVFGVDGSAAIINHPEVAILGMGRVIDRPWVMDGQLTVRKVTELTLSFDHRACDGGTAGGFLRYVADCIESPAVALGDM